MNKLSIIIDAVLGAAVVVLFVLFFVSRPCCQKQPVRVAGEGGQAAIAYVNLDSIITGYQFAIDANERLMSKQEDARLKLANKATALQNEAAAWQKEAAEFQQKMDANAFLSRERAESEYNRIQRKQMALQQKQEELARMEQELTEEILRENEDLNLQLRDSLSSFLKEYNKEAGYQAILGNTQMAQTILVAEEGMDITDEVIAALNARYKK